MTPAGISSSFVPRTGGPKKRKDPYGLDPTGEYGSGPAKMLNINLGNDKFQKPKLRKVQHGHANQPVDYPIFRDIDRISSKIKPFVDKDKREVRAVQKEREGYSEDEEREDDQEVIGDGMSRGDERSSRGKSQGRSGSDNGGLGSGRGALSARSNGERSVSPGKNERGVESIPGPKPWPKSGSSVDGRGGTAKKSREDSLDRLRTPITAKQPRGGPTPMPSAPFLNTKQRTNLLDSASKPENQGYSYQKTPPTNNQGNLAIRNPTSSQPGGMFKPQSMTQDNLNNSADFRTPLAPYFGSKEAPPTGNGIGPITQSGKNISPILKGPQPNSIELSQDVGEMSQDLTVGRPDQTGHINIEGETYQGPNPVGKALFQTAGGRPQDRGQGSSATAGFGSGDIGSGNLPIPTRGDFDRSPQNTGSGPRQVDWNRSNSFHDQLKQEDVRGSPSATVPQPRGRDLDKQGRNRQALQGADSLDKNYSRPLVSRGGAEQPLGRYVPSDNNYSRGPEASRTTGNMYERPQDKSRTQNLNAPDSVYNQTSYPGTSDNKSATQNHNNPPEMYNSNYQLESPYRGPTPRAAQNRDNSYEPGRYSRPTTAPQPDSNTRPYTIGPHQGEDIYSREPANLNSVLPNYGSSRIENQGGSGLPPTRDQQQQNIRDSEEKLFQYSATNERPNDRGDPMDSNVRSSFQDQLDIHDYMRAEREQREVPAQKIRSDIFYSKEKPNLHYDGPGAYEAANKLLSSKIIGHLTHHQVKVEQMPEMDRREESRQYASTRPAVPPQIPRDTMQVK